MTDNHYYHKYLKYKKKYLDLKNDIDGGMRMFKTKPLTKEKFDKELQKIETDVYNRSQKLKNQYIKAIALAQSNQNYLSNMRSKCSRGNFIEKEGYTSVGQCERANNPAADEKRERINTANLSDFQKAHLAILNSIDSIKNSTNDLDNKLQVLKAEYKTFKTSFPISWR